MPSARKPSKVMPARTPKNSAAANPLAATTSMDGEMICRYFTTFMLRRKISLTRFLNREIWVS